MHPGTSLFNGMSVPIHGIGNQERIITHRWITKTLTDAFEAFPQNFFFDFWMPTESESWIGYSHQTGSLKQSYRHAVAGIVTMLIHTTQRPDPSSLNTLQSFTNPFSFVLRNFVGPNQKLTDQIQSIFLGQSLVNIDIFS